MSNFSQGSFFFSREESLGLLLRRKCPRGWSSYIYSHIFTPSPGLQCGNSPLPLQLLGAPELGGFLLLFHRVNLPSLTVVGKQGFPGGSVGKESACSAGDSGSIPGSGWSPGEGNNNPLQQSCLENSMDSGAWQATVHQVAKSQFHGSLNQSKFCEEEGENRLGTLVGDTLGCLANPISSLLSDFVHTSLMTLARGWHRRETMAQFWPMGTDGTPTQSFLKSFFSS